MAMARYATFSVADHLDVRTLVPDVLLFDKLAFPFPPDADSWAHWRKKQWQPERLESCLVTLDDLAIAYDWGIAQHREFRNKLSQSADVQNQSVSVRELTRAVPYDERWDMAKSITRGLIADRLHGTRGVDFWVMPTFASKGAYLHDDRATIAPAQKGARRDRLALLAAQEITLPDDADPAVALRLAAELARDPTFQKSRRTLFNWQEATVQREQNSKNDAQDLADAIEGMNREVVKATKTTRSRWVVFVLKTALGIPEAIHTALSAGKAVLETAEFGRGEHRDDPIGPLAAFQHIRGRVLTPSLVKPSRWKRSR